MSLSGGIGNVFSAPAFGGACLFFPDQYEAFLEDEVDRGGWNGIGTIVVAERIFLTFRQARNQGRYFIYLAETIHVRSVLFIDIIMDLIPLDGDIRHEPSVLDGTTQYRICFRYT